MPYLQWSPTTRGLQLMMLFIIRLSCRWFLSSNQLIVWSTNCRATNSLHNVLKLKLMSSIFWFCPTKTLRDSILYHIRQRKAANWNSGLFGIFALNDEFISYIGSQRLSSSLEVTQRDLLERNILEFAFRAVNTSQTENNLLGTL